MQSLPCTRPLAPISRPTGSGLPDLKKLDAEYQTLSSEKNGFYTRYKKAQIELRELRTAQQNVEAFFRKEERSHAVPQQEVK